MSNEEILEQKVKALEELLSIKDRIINELKNADWKIQYPQYYPFNPTYSTQTLQTPQYGNQQQYGNYSGQLGSAIGIATSNTTAGLSNITTINNSSGAV